MLRKYLEVNSIVKLCSNISFSADGSKTVEQYIAAAAKVGSTVAPSKAQGGILGPASAVVVPSSTPTGAGVEARGSFRWGLSLTGLLAVAVAGLII